MIFIANSGRINFLPELEGNKKYYQKKYNRYAILFYTIALLL